MNVELIETPTDNGRAYNLYHLKVSDLPDGQPEKVFLIADFSRMGGGVRLRRWKSKKHQGKSIVSVYLEISSMGHDLDQWVHYDLVTGEKIKDSSLDPKSRS